MPANYTIQSLGPWSPTRYARQKTRWRRGCCHLLYSERRPQASLDPNRNRRARDVATATIRTNVDTITDYLNDT